MHHPTTPATEEQLLAQCEALPPGPERMEKLMQLEEIRQANSDKVAVSDE